MTRTSLVAAMFFFGASAATASAEPAPLSVRVVSPLVQVFPTSVPPGEPAARLDAARGEWEPFQIVVHASAGALRGVTAATASLVGPKGATVAAPRLYRVGYVEVT